MIPDDLRDSPKTQLSKATDKIGGVNNVKSFKDLPSVEKVGDKDSFTMRLGERRNHFGG